MRSNHLRHTAELEALRRARSDQINQNVERLLRHIDTIAGVLNVLWDTFIRYPQRASRDGRIRHGPQVSRRRRALPINSKHVRPSR